MTTKIDVKVITPIATAINQLKGPARCMLLIVNDLNNLQTEIKVIAPESSVNEQGVTLMRLTYQDYENEFPRVMALKHLLVHRVEARLMQAGIEVVIIEDDFVHY